MVISGPLTSPLAYQGADDDGDVNGDGDNGSDDGGDKDDNDGVDDDENNDDDNNGCGVDDNVEEKINMKNISKEYNDNDNDNKLLVIMKLMI